MGSKMIDFIQIGAHTGFTPESEDIIWPIVRERKWRGVFIEPMLESFNQLKENYSDLEGSFFENVAITAHNGTVLMRFEDNGDLRIASVNAYHVHERNRDSIEVPCCTLMSIIEKYNLVDVPFELLQIDTESLDGDILLSTDFTHVLPTYIRFEHCHLGKKNIPCRGDVMQHLAKFGYKEIPDMYNNNIANETGIDTMVERMLI
jgi:FkbM family methyltransferase